MFWNKDLAGFIIVLLMFTLLTIIIIKRNKLEKGSNYFILAIGLLTCIEIGSWLGNHYSKNYNSTILYVIGVNLIGFFLFFLYFHQMLKSEKLKKINLILIILFLANYLFFALTDSDFFKFFPFFSYFVEVVLLVSSIYLVMSQAFNSDRILNLVGYFPFWVCISSLIIYLGVMPLLIISITAENMMNINIFYIIMFFVNFIGYSILLFGIIKVKNTI